MHDTTCTNSQFFLHTVIQYNSSLFLSTRLYCVTFLLLLFCVVDLHFISERTNDKKTMQRLPTEVKSTAQLQYWSRFTLILGFEFLKILL
jgi:hypothetical protein